MIFGNVEEESRNVLGNAIDLGVPQFWPDIKMHTLVLQRIRERLRGHTGLLP